MVLGRKIFMQKAPSQLFWKTLNKLLHKMQDKDIPQINFESQINLFFI